MDQPSLSLRQTPLPHAASKITDPSNTLQKAFYCGNYGSNSVSGNYTCVITAAETTDYANRGITCPQSAAIIPGSISIANPKGVAINNQSIKWDEIALQAGVGLSESGRPRSGMGVDAADLHGSGYQDLFVSNVDHENYSVYLNNKDESFTDAAQIESVAHSTRLMSGWGLKYFDYDNDGLLDLILANGHPDDMIDAYSMQVKYKEPLLLYHQNADRKLHDVSADAGPAFHRDWAARGLAVGDYNNDGAVDVIVGVNGGAPVLLKNNAAHGNGWLGLKLEGVTCNRDAIGARIVWKAGGTVRSRLKNSGGSYLSSHDPREVLGIGSATLVDAVEIHWPLPSKQVDTLTNVAPNRYLHIVEGKGVV